MDTQGEMIMKRLWIGVSLMVILLAVGITVLLISRNFHGEFTELLEQADACAAAGNWEAAGELAAKGREKWEAYRHFWSAFTDHEPVEQMQNLFSQLEIYQKRQLEVDFSGVCRNLVNVAEAIDESHGLKWWSVL